MDLNFLHETDMATLKLERARRELESAKSAFENAKLDYESVLSKSEEVGVNRAKIKKLSEERVLALFESGLIESTAAMKPVAREPKSKKPKRERADEAFDALPEDAIAEATL